MREERRIRKTSQPSGCRRGLGLTVQAGVTDPDALHSCSCIVILENDLVSAALLTEEEARLAIAISLFAQERLSLACAARLAGLDRLSFQRCLAAREIPLHYGEDELDADLATVRWLREDRTPDGPAHGQE